MPRFDHFYVQATHSPADALRDTLSADGWRPYDPFPGGIGTPPALKHFVRLLVAPPVGGWVRIYGDPAAAFPDIITALSAGSLLIHVWLAEPDSGVDAYLNGQAVPQQLAAFVRDDPAHHDETQIGPVILPAGLDSLARRSKVNPAQASGLINKLARQVLGGKEQADQAGALLSGSGPDWSSAAGRALAQRIGQLALPADPRLPPFETVREAYHAARALARNPNATLLPNERAALNEIQDAAQYQAVYFGKP